MNARAECAFIIVSWVVNVFDDTMNRLLPGSSPAQSVAEVGAVDVGHEMRPEPGLAEGAQGARGHRRAEIGAADADIDDVGEGFAFGAPDASRAHGLGESGDLGAFGEHVVHHVVPLDHDRAAGEIAQRHMQRRTPFGRVDAGAGKQRRALVLEAGIAGENEEMGQGHVVDAVLRIIEQEIVEPQVIALETPRIVAEHIGERVLADVDAMGLERGQRGANLGL